jgi:nucleotide-binding universal stress UspA family protein
VLGAILCATDFSPASGAAWAFAQRLGRGTGARLVLLHVIPATPAPRAASVEARETQATLGRLVEFPLDDLVPVALCVEEGSAASRILEVAEREAVDLVVVGTHGRTGLDRLVLGSVAEDVVQQASTPVVTVRPLPALREAAGRPVRRLLYATDGLSGAGRVRAWATALAKATGADLDVVELGSVDAVVRHAVAREADLLVLDTTGDIPLPGVALGGVTRRLLHTAPCPVLTVGPRFRAPEAGRAR